MEHVEYLLLLIAGWTSLVLADLHCHAGVLRRWRRLLPIEAVCLGLFLGWDSLGVHRGYWSSDPRRVVGLWPLPGVPVEEVILLAMITYASLVLWQLVQIWPNRRHNYAGMGGEPARGAEALRSTEEP